jgi:arylformamidase
MICEFSWGGSNWVAELSGGVDLSIPLRGNAKENPTAWYVAPPTMEPVRGEGFVGSVAEGGAVNFRTISFNPHGHGTHTESLGHITRDIKSVDDIFRSGPAFFPCQVLSVQPLQVSNGDSVIDADHLHGLTAKHPVDALAVRTLPNDPAKARCDWSNTNPPYFTTAFMERVVALGVKHLLVDLPSVDREEDGGALAAHRAFWNVPTDPRHQATITEMIFVPDHVNDGLHLLHLGVAPFDNDASSSRPVLFKLKERKANPKNASLPGS